MTDLQQREQRLREIIAFADLDRAEHRVLIQQLDALSNLGVEVCHALIVRVASREIEPLIRRRRKEQARTCRLLKTK